MAIRWQGSVGNCHPTMGRISASHSDLERRPFGMILCSSFDQVIPWKNHPELEYFPVQNDPIYKFAINKPVVVSSSLRFKTAKSRNNALFVIIQVNYSCFYILPTKINKIKLTNLKEYFSANNFAVSHLLFDVFYGSSLRDQNVLCFALDLFYQCDRTQLHAPSISRDLDEMVMMMQSRVRSPTNVHRPPLGWKYFVSLNNGWHRM